MQTILKVQINLCSSDSGQTNIHEINIPLAHYFPSNPTDTSCSASQPAQLKVKRLRANAFPSSSYTLQETFLPPALLSLFGRWWIQYTAASAAAMCCSECKGEQKQLANVISTAFATRWAFHRPCVSDSSRQNKDWPQHTSWHWGVFASLLLCITAIRWL